MQQIPKWQYDERKFGGVDFADISEVLEKEYRDGFMAVYLCQK